MITEPMVKYVSNQAQELDRLSEKIMKLSGLDDFMHSVLPELVHILKTHYIGCYLSDSRLQAPLYFSDGLSRCMSGYMERSCVIEFNSYIDYYDSQYSIPAFAAPHTCGSLQYYPVLNGSDLMGLLQIEDGIDIIFPEKWENFLTVFSETTTRLVNKTVNRK